MRPAFAARFRQALAEAGYADAQLKELAALFGVSGQAVRKWLNAEALPGPARAPEVAAKLGVRRAWLLDGEEPVRTLVMQDTQGRYQEYQTPGLSVSAGEYRLLKNYRCLPRSLQSSFDTTLEEICRTLHKQKKGKKNKDAKKGKGSKNNREERA